MADTPLLPLIHNEDNVENEINLQNLCVNAFVRSEKMSLLQIYIPVEFANMTVAELGMIGIAQFLNANSQQNWHKLNFSGEIRRCQEMNRIIRYFENELNRLLSKEQLPLVKTNSMYRFFNSIREFEEMERTLSEKETRLRTISSGIAQLEFKLNSLCIQRALLKELRAVLKDTSTDEITYDTQLIIGCISADKYYMMERIIWKMLRGNIIFKCGEMPDFPFRNFFVIYVHGVSVRERVKAACISVGAKTIDSSFANEPIDEAISATTAQILRISQILENSQMLQLEELRNVKNHIGIWKECISREEKIYSVLNLFEFDSNKRYLHGKCWCPSENISLITSCLERITYQSNSDMGPFATELHFHDLTPPTHIKTTKFTKGFQDLMDAYGIPMYQELNPAAFSIITFPFLFAVMFGDVGHGMIMFCFAVWMIIKEQFIQKSTKEIFNNEIFKMAFGGRYILFLMGLFSLFTGLIYNDAFSRPICLFQSGWIFKGLERKPVLLNVYPFGIDWAWLRSSNSLSFLNSYKMKQSILFGLMHMYFGIILSACNHMHFNRKMNILYETIPQMLFLSSIFGYLGLLILYKWAITTSNHPSLLTTIIDMVLNPINLNKKDRLFSYQKEIQIALLVTAFLSAIWMLLSKPIAILLSRYRTRSIFNYASLNSSHSPVIPCPQLAEQIQPTSEIFLNQAIHTIEFVLGSISNTASYLRLWALSLAHAQLSEVLWGMIVHRVSNSLLIVKIIAYILWLVLTLFIMVVLEGLSAFLHSLRLHWVEFNGKFFHGDGLRFTPFSFQHNVDQ